MFKRFRSSRCAVEPPQAPTADEIFSDLETFQVQSHFNPTKKSEDSIEQWWQEFEIYAEAHKNLKILDKEIDGTMDKLKKHKKELETKTTIMKKEIEQQKSQIADVCS